MRLSDIPRNLAMPVRDCDFHSLGFIGRSGATKLSFIDDPSQLPELKNDTHVACVIANEESAESIDPRLGLCISENPQRTFVEIHNWLARESEFYGKSFPSRVDRKAVVHPTAFVASDCVEVGPFCEIGPNAVILERVVLGEGVIVRPGSVIGIDQTLPPRFAAVKPPPTASGWVEIHRYVDVHANCCINKPIFGGRTEIGEFTKLDNLVEIGPNARVGKRCLLVAACALAEDAEIGNDVWIGPNSTVSQGIRVGDGAFITIGAVVVNDVSAGQRVSGNFAIDHDKFIALMRRIR